MSKLNIQVQDALKALKAVNDEIKNIKKSTSSMNQANKDSFDKLEKSINSIRNKLQEHANKLNHVQAYLKQNAAALKQNTTATQNNTKATNQNNTSKSKSSNLLNQATAANKKNTQAVAQNTKQQSKFKKSLAGVGVSLNTIIQAFGIMATIRIFTDLVKDIFNTSKTLDSLNFAMERVTKTSFSLGSSTRFLMQITRDFGVELVPTTNRYIKFLAAAEQSGLSLKQTEDIFRSLTKAGAVLGLQTEELQGIYLALEQMLSKGKVTTEELRRQLGERLPGAMGIMAASMGKTIPELDKMMKSGLVLSAEVLPGFARAVETAFGIEQVEKVETLVAAQNKLTTAWQTFILNLNEGDGVLKKIFGGLLKFLEGAINGMNRLIETEQQLYRRRLSGSEESARKSLETEAELAAGRKLGIKDVFEYKKLMLENERKLNDTVNEDEKKRLKAEITEQQNLLGQIHAEKMAILKNNAIEYFDIAKENFNKSKKQYDDFLAYVEDEAKQSTAKDIIELAIGDVDDENVKEIIIEYEARGIDSAEEILELLRTKAISDEAMFNFYKKVIEESNVQVLPDNTEGKTQRQLRAIKDLTLEIEREIIQSTIARNEEVLKTEFLTYDERRKLLESQRNLQEAESKKTLAIKLRDIEIAGKAELESLEKSVAAGRLSRAKYNDFVEKQALERQQKIEIAEEEHSQRMLQIIAKFRSGLDDIESEINQDELDRIQQKYDLQVIAIKDEYNASKKTAEDKAIMERKLRDVAIEAANEIIKAKIKVLEATKATLVGEEEALQKIQEQIDALRASLKVPDGDGDSDYNWEEYFIEILATAREYIGAIGDLFDAVYERRIENINAEIEAEKQKYDELIRLAEGDEEQQDTLRRNKEDKIRKLERKRLKEEQKQARARKAFAIADITVSTAQAIMRAYSDGGPFAGPVLQGIIAALGAIQIAAVLAAPIPQYKDGGTAKKDEVAMINDGIFQEYVEREGRVFTTKRKNAIVGLKKDDIVYRNYNEMVKRSTLFKESGSNKNIINKFEKELEVEAIEKAITRGFNNAKINNSVNVKIFDDSYRRSMIKWN